LLEEYAMKILSRLASLLILSSLSSLNYAEVYRYITPDGRLLLTDTPKHSGYTQLVKTHQGWVPKKNEYYKASNKRKLSQHIRKAADTHQLPYALIHAVIRVESAFNPQAVSKAGAQGLMQLMPATAARFGVQDPFNPIENIRGGSTYLRHLLTLFNNNYALALAAYNSGENTVIRYGNKIPPYRETQNYVRKVLKLYRNNPAT
jgi:soluble lytic murein transglycosylase-like protein